MLYYVVLGRDCSERCMGLESSSCKVALYLVANIHNRTTCVQLKAWVNGAE